MGVMCDVQSLDATFKIQEFNETIFNNLWHVII